MDLIYEMGVGGLSLVAAGALLLGGALQLVGDSRFEHEWLLTALGAFTGAMVASEMIVALQAIEPVWDGLALIPALVGGLVGGVAIALVVRFVTGGSYLHGPHAA
jgi:hypothetical protein